MTDQPPVLNEEDSARVLEAVDEHMSCTMCPYYTPYNINIVYGTIGHCAALETLAQRKESKGFVGRVRARIMRTLAGFMWSLLVDGCPYHKRAQKIELEAQP